MEKLPIPLGDVPVNTIYETCAKGFTNEEKTKRIMHYAMDAVNASKEYVKKVPKDITSFPPDTVPEADKTDVIDLYDKKFSSQQFPSGRVFYDKIMAFSGGKCAVCGIGQATTLDHYLPKTKHPLLCVFPANLVPECQDCNKSKGSYFSEKSEDMLVHPYFDDFSEITWLEVELVFDQEMKYRYYNAYTADEKISSRLSLTLEKYKLASLFAVQANDFVKNNARLWKDLLETSGEKGLKDYFNKMKDSYEAVDRNSWSTALLRAICRQSDEIIPWIS